MGVAMQIKIFLFINLIFFASCNKPRDKTIVKVPAHIKSFSFQSEAKFFYQDVEFGPEGAFFNNNTNPSFVKINGFKKNIGNEFNVSFWFRSNGDPKNSKMLISVSDTLNKLKRFKFWLSGRRLTGIFNSNHLWAKGYDYKNEKSKAYYDSYKLDNGKFYFLSLNVSMNKIDIFINSERYQVFNFIKNNEINAHEFLIGVENNQNGYINQYFGTISFLKIFPRNLTVNEIYSANKEKLNYFKVINDAHELKKFKP